ncbi:hypothetical protein J6590_006615 [Homalodisca vitripennis]|nr:hypothetical protein J6590_006615 [Homalodisca vitripennis]
MCNDGGFTQLGVFIFITHLVVETNESHRESTTNPTGPPQGGPPQPHVHGSPYATVNMVKLARRQFADSPGVS